MGHLAGDDVVIDLFAAVGGDVLDAFGHGPGGRVEVVPAAIAVILALDHMAVGVIADPFATVRTQIDIFVARHDPVRVNPIPGIAVGVEDLLAASIGAVGILPVFLTVARNPMGRRVHVFPVAERIHVDVAADAVHMADARILPATIVRRIGEVGAGTVTGHPLGLGPNVAMVERTVQIARIRVHAQIVVPSRLQTTPPRIHDAVIYIRIGRYLMTRPRPSLQVVIYREGQVVRRNAGLLEQSDQIIALCGGRGRIIRI